MMKHIGEKPYECVEWGKIIQACNLSQHMLIHTREKPHTCTECEAKFSKAGNLYKQIVTHTGELYKPHNCKICWNTFRECCNLKSHMRIHTGEKPHEC